jgi:branched-chain amino acid transport system permease protein
VNLLSLLPALIVGILQGALYGGIAVGLSLIFGVMRVVNFAHGSILALSMFVAYYSSRAFGLDSYAGLLFAVPFCFLLGYLIQSVLITPLYRRERAFTIEPTSVLIFTAGLYLVFDNGTLLTLGSSYRSAPSHLSNTIIHIGSTDIALTRIIAAAGALLLTAALMVLLHRTNIGRQMRATAQNRDAAALAGINVYRIYAITFGIGAAVTGAAGALLLPFFYVFPSVGFSFDIRAFLIVVLGGMGSIKGTFLAGIIMGVVEAVFAQVWTATYAQLAFFLLFVIVLVARPQGLFGRERI